MKKSLLLLLCGLLVLSLTACDKTIDSLVGGGDGDNTDDLPDYEANAVKLDQATTYHNEYLGVSFAVPAGWYVYDIYEDNFATAEGLTADGGAMDINRGDGYKFMFLIDCANLQDSSKSNHMQFTLYAHQTDDYSSIADYMDYYDADQLDYYGYNLLESDSIQIGNQFAQVRLYEELDEDDYQLYYLNFVMEAADGYFFVAECSYWPENTDGRTYITNYLQEHLTVDTPTRPTV